MPINNMIQSIENISGIQSNYNTESRKKKSNGFLLINEGELSLI